VAETHYMKTAASQIGVSPVTLKRWILQGKVRDVQRDRNGWRVFREEDIRRLRAFASSVSEEAETYTGPRAISVGYSVASFFSGIGGFELGFERQGFATAFQCELDDFCRSILQDHWSNTTRSENIRDISNGADVPSADVWVGGFPCQDVSLARMGPRKGLRGQQSGLFNEFARLLGEGRPRVFVIENVPGLLNSHGGLDFQTVISTLAKLGYCVGWRTLNSKDFGVPQSRRRVYIVGCRGDWRGPGSILFEPERSGGNAPTSGPNGKNPVSPFKRVLGDTSGEGPVYQSIAYCLYACSARHTGTDWSRTYITYPRLGKVRRLTPRECEGIMGFPFDWTIPSSPQYPPDVIESKRYHALGNAVTPNVVAWLARRIGMYLKHRDEPARNGIAAAS